MNEIVVQSTQFRRVRLIRKDVRPDGGALFKCTVHLNDDEKIVEPDQCFISVTPRVLREPGDEDVKASTFSAGFAVQSVTENEIVIWFRRTDQIEWDRHPPLALSIAIGDNPF